MAFGNNRAQTQSRAHFQLAGGSIIKFRHPYLAGQIDAEVEGTAGTTAIDEIDISACCKLEGRFFEARQNQDSAKQIVLVDGSTVTISNKLLNGTITMPVVKGKGLVAKGDFIAALQLIRSLGDSVGGLLYKTDFIDGKAITKLYYGVTPQSVPDDISEGNDVPVYDVKLLYAGWIEAVSTSTAENKKRIWATGNQQGLEAYFSPYIMQDGSTGNTALTALNSGMPKSTLADQVDDTNYNTLDGTTEATVLSDGWKSNDTVLVGDATVISSEVQSTDNAGQKTETETQPAEG